MNEVDQRGTISADDAAGSGLFLNAPVPAPLFPDIEANFARATKSL